eukprot:TRINITY_DN16105_c0_g1_i1.p1 TRINITY_DN16105_c0_g1~~TRINITY_DN16105_c0_g1_i1.p1  ORF type:complete len:380 (+),score=65.57 TRINITY_DN16105_c0_g1_i1:86-1141(+)
MGKFFRRRKEFPAGSKQRQPSPDSPISCGSTCCSEISEDKLTPLTDSEEEEPTSKSFPSALPDTHKRWNLAVAGRALSDMPIEKIQAMVQDGIAIPPKHRAVLWPRWFAAEATQPLPNSVDSPFLSAALVQELQAQVPEDVAHLIDLDVPRTMPGRLRESEHDVLRRTLCCLAALQPEVGYCQGLNNIAAVFVLLGFDDAMAAAGSHCLLSKCCPGYHQDGLPGFRRDAAILQRLTNKLPEETRCRIEALGVPLEALASQHFLALSAGDWPLTATLQLWDLLFLEGRPALMASFLAMLQLYLPPVSADCFEEEEEPVEVFRRNIKRGLAREPGQLLKQTGELLALTRSACS